jgi:predicted nucleotidyltransferase
VFEVPTATPAQQRLIDAGVAAAQADRRIESLWLSGSLAAGTGDEWSDVDLVAVVRADEDPESVADAWARDLGAIADYVHSIRPFPRLISVVARDWARFDVLFMAPFDLVGQPGKPLAALFLARGAAEPDAPLTSRSHGQFDVERVAREFLRVVGLGPGVMARGHFIIALDGMQILRSLCIDLMLAETGHSRTDASPKRLESLLTDEQRAALRSLPPLSATQESVIETQVELCRLFLPRARAFAATQGALWPSEFEAATRAWIRDSLGIELE